MDMPPLGISKEKNRKKRSLWETIENRSKYRNRNKYKRIRNNFPLRNVFKLDS